MVGSPASALEVRRLAIVAAGRADGVLC